MKPIQVHPLSLILGASSVLGLALLLSMAAPQLAQELPGKILRRVVVEGYPRPQDMVQIEEGVPFTVPAGKVFVLTGLGVRAIATAASAYLRVAGVVEAQALPAGDPLVSMREFPLGFTVPANRVITVDHSTGDARAWGYLADE